MSTVSAISSALWPVGESSGEDGDREERGGEGAPRTPGEEIEKRSEGFPGPGD